MTHLRKLMLDELQRRNYAQNTVRAYIHAVEDFAKYFRRSPNRLGPGHIREYQVHLFRDCKLSPGTIEGRTAALRFLFVKTLRRPYLPDHIPFPKRQRRLPIVLSQEEIARLIASAQNLMHRTMLMTLYATGLRRAELCHLKVSDIDSQRMVIHVRQGKGGRDRDVLLTPKLLQTLREYWRWMKPRTYLFPGTVNNWRADVPITEKIVWTAVAEAAKHAGITKHVSPHTLEFWSSQHNRRSRLTQNYDAETLSGGMSLVASTGGFTLLPLYVRTTLIPSVVVRPLRGEVPFIDLMMGYSKSNTSPLLKDSCFALMSSSTVVQIDVACEAARSTEQPEKPGFVIGFLLGQEVIWLSESLRICARTRPK